PPRGLHLIQESRRDGRQVGLHPRLDPPHPGVAGHPAGLEEDPPGRRDQRRRQIGCEPAAPWFGADDLPQLPDDGLPDRLREIFPGRINQDRRCYGLSWQVAWHWLQSATSIRHSSSSSGYLAALIAWTVRANAASDRMSSLQTGR